MIPFKDIVTALAPIFGIKVVLDLDDEAPDKVVFTELYRTINAARFTLDDMSWVGVEHTMGSANLMVTTRDGARLSVAVGMPPARVPAAQLFSRALLGWASESRLTARLDADEVSAACFPGCVKTSPHTGACMTGQD